MPTTTRVTAASGSPSASMETIETAQEFICRGPGCAVSRVAATSTTIRSGRSSLYTVNVGVWLPRMRTTVSCPPSATSSRATIPIFPDSPRAMPRGNARASPITSRIGRETIRVTPRKNSCSGSFADPARSPKALQITAR
jgi:hypothetical protein